MALIGGILAEAVLGGVVVYSKLNPYVVMTHFMVGIALLTVAVILALRSGRAAGPGPLMVTPAVRRLARVMVGVLVLAIAAGTATTGAGPHAGGKGAKRIPVPLADMARTHAEIVIVLGVLTLATLYLLDRTRAPARVVERGPDPPGRDGGPGDRRLHPVLHPSPRPPRRRPRLRGHRPLDDDDLVLRRPDPPPVGIRPRGRRPTGPLVARSAAAAVGADELASPTAPPSTVGSGR